MNENVLPISNNTKLSIKYFSNVEKTELDKKDRVQSRRLQVNTIEMKSNWTFTNYTNFVGKKTNK